MGTVQSFPFSLFPFFFQCKVTPFAKRMHVIFGTSSPLRIQALSFRGQVCLAYFCAFSFRLHLLTMPLTIQSPCLFRFGDFTLHLILMVLIWNLTFWNEFSFCEVDSSVTFFRKQHPIANQNAILNLTRGIIELLIWFGKLVGVF